MMKHKGGYEVVKIIFVCVENSCRSQMAEGFARYYGKEMSLRAKSEAISVYSAGSRPSGDVNPMAVDVMEEKRIDISNQKSKGLDTLPRDDFDFVITMG